MLSVMSTENATRVVTGKVRLSYVNAFKPKAIQEGQEPKYSVAIIIPKSDKATLAKINAGIKAAIENGKDKLAVKGVLPKNIKSPLRDGDEERPDDPAYENCYFLNANSKNKPQVVDVDRNEIHDPLDLYSGCYGRVSINFYAFNTNGNKGVAAGLGNIQKLAEGEPLSASNVSAATDFGDDFENEDDL